MIQRIQTVYLLLALVALALFLWMPLLRVEAPHFPPHDYHGYEIYYRFKGYLYFVNAILAGTAVGLTLISIFLYKNRKLQVLFCWFAILFIVFAQAFTYYEYHTWIFLGDVVLRKWNLFSLASAIAIVLAIVYINRDEETIKGLERLR